MSATVYPFQKPTVDEDDLRARRAIADALLKPTHSLCCARRQLDDAASIAVHHHRTTARFRTLIAMLDELIEDAAELQTSLKPTPSKT